MLSIELRSGEKVWIDDDDYGIVSQFQWYLLTTQSGHRYAIRVSRHCKVQRTIYMHKAIMGDMPELDVDHINGDGLDNRRTNLRWATRQQNQGNRKPEGGTSKYRGVWWDKSKGKWRAGLTINRKSVNLGSYSLETDAALAYNAAAFAHFGAYAKLNILSDYNSKS